MLTVGLLNHSVFEEKLDDCLTIYMRLRGTQYSIEVLSAGRIQVCR